MERIEERPWARRSAVAAGGAVGTAARYAVVSAVPAAAGVPVATLAVNLAGAFLLGLLSAVLAGRRRGLLWSFASTGVLAALTTFATFALEVLVLAATSWWGAAAYLLVSVGGGLGAGALGLRAGTRA